MWCYFCGTNIEAHVGHAYTYVTESGERIRCCHECMAEARRY